MLGRFIVSGFMMFAFYVHTESATDFFKTIARNILTRIYNDIESYRARHGQGYDASNRSEDRKKLFLDLKNAKRNEARNLRYEQQKELGAKAKEEYVKNSKSRLQLF